MPLCLLVVIYVCFFDVNHVETRTCLKTSFKPTNQNLKQFRGNKFALNVNNKIHAIYSYVINHDQKISSITVNR